MRYDLIRCARCHLIKAADPGHALCRTCEGYPPTNDDEAAVKREDQSLICPHTPQCDPITYCVDAVKVEDR